MPSAPIIQGNRANSRPARVEFPPRAERNEYMEDAGDRGFGMGRSWFSYSTLFDEEERRALSNFLGKGGGGRFIDDATYERCVSKAAGLVLRHGRASCSPHHAICCLSPPRKHVRRSPTTYGGPDQPSGSTPQVTHTWVLAICV